MREALVKLLHKGGYSLVLWNGNTRTFTRRGVAELHTDVISEAALALLAAADVKVSYDRVVTHIINREGTGHCPVEMLCREAKTAEECLPLIQNFMKRQRA